MSHFVPASVVSGRSYPVLKVAEGEPAGLEDFLGTTRFVLDLDGSQYVVCGFGRQVADGVRFYQKESEGFGRDIRVWTVCRQGADDGFSAAHLLG